MEILSVGCLLIVLIFLCVNILAEKKVLRWIAGICIYLGSCFFVYFTSCASPMDVHSKKHQIKTEIRVESLNGQEISRDTIYTFTPKKK